MIEIAVGEGTESLVGFVFDAGGSINGEVIRSGQPLLASDLATVSAGGRVQGRSPAVMVGPSRTSTTTFCSGCSRRGMTMQAMSASVGEPYAERLEQLIVDTDETIARDPGGHPRPERPALPLRGAQAVQWRALGATGSGRRS